MKKALFFFMLACASAGVFAQDKSLQTFSNDVGKGTLSGDLMTNVNFFMKDTNIKASGNPLYSNYLSGNEAWLTLRYNVSGYTFFLRGDAFDNSNLKNPTQAYTNFGVGAWSISKDFNDLSLTVGYIYDQIGSGLLFRSYEDRGLLIDNALKGLELKYKLGSHITLKGFSGQQKNVFDTYPQVIKGFAADGDFQAGQVHLSPGAGVINRTLDDNSYQTIAADIKAQTDTLTYFTPVYNTYAFSLYNMLNYKNITWYVEGAYKTHEAIYNLQRTLLIDRPGNSEYTTLSYGRKGIGINASAKRSENFVMRTNTLNSLNDGMLNWQPVVAIQRPERLISRYTPASQDQSELAENINVLLSPNDVTNYTFSYTHIDQLDGTELYREGYGEWYYQGLKQWIFQVGVQYLEYNQKVYQNQAAANIIYAVTPFTEITYRFTDVKSLRIEGQYMASKQDYGSWIYLLAEYNVAPHYSLSISDMYNVDPVYDNFNHIYKANHYPTAYLAYAKGPHRFSLAYVKQVDGINCTGGVCRYEPAFSGVKATLTTSF